MKRLLVALGLALAATAGVGGAPAASAQSAERLEFGPAIGAKIPAVSVVTSGGAPATFDSLKGQKGMVLAFVRSADWCPFCKAQLKDLNTIAADLKAEGYPLVALSYDSQEKLQSFSDQNKLGYTLVADKGSVVIDAFGLRNAEMAGKGRFDGIPHPMILIIGADGVVKAKLYEPSYQKRPPSPLVLQTVQALN
jgi:peroxiredoxin